MAERTDDLAPGNISTLDRLVHSIDLAEGFALFLARCNVPALRGELILTARQQLAALGVEVVEVAFEDEAANVRERLRAALALANEETEAPIAVEFPVLEQSLAVAEPPSGYTVGAKRAVFVTGLEYGPYDQPNARALAKLNLDRDAFPRDVPHPLVIWLPDYAVTAVARFAPDFWAWRSGVFEFETGQAERSIAFEQVIWRDQPWHTLTNLTPEARLLRRRQLESLLDDYCDLPDDLRLTRERAGILADLGDVCITAHDYRNAAVYYKRALTRYRQLDDQANEATMLSSLGYVYDALEDGRQALDFYEQALPLRRQVGDRGGEATTLNNIGYVYEALGDKPQALKYYEQALPLCQQVGDRVGEANTFYSIGVIHEALGDKRQALQYYEQALKLTRQVGDLVGEAKALTNIGGVHYALGDKHKTLAFYEQALPLRRQVGDRQGESVTRFNMGMVYEALGDLAKAEEQLALVVALDEAIGHPNLASHRAALERIQAQRQAGSGKR